MIESRILEVKGNEERSMFSDEEYERMLYVIMAILCEYIEEGDYDLIDWSINNYHITQSTNMLKAYIWWRYDRPDEDEPVNRWVNGEISLEECERQERWIDEKDQEMLHCVINSRLNLS